MTVWQFVRATWMWEPSVVGGCLLLAAGYLAVVGAKPTRHAAAFFGGIAVLVLALDSPLDTLGDTYLFSAHMVQHLLLILIVPPLLLLGLPASPVVRAWRVPWIRRAMAALGAPALAWGLGIGTMAVWHVPALYNAALANGGVHVAQHLSFLVTSTIFWWPVLAPAEDARLGPLPAVLYLVAAALASSVVGIIVTFAKVGLYPAYLLPVDRLGVGPLIRNVWGLTPDLDQELGGLLMWIPGGLVYLCAILGVMARWYKTGEPAEPIAVVHGRPREADLAAGPVEG
jgi:cytochrome c oxidase assembly factor CtaG